MSRIPANRLFVFLLLASVALAIDLYTKSLVFNDLGYPGAEPTPSALGQHHRFASPASREGESVRSNRVSDSRLVESRESR